jgi:hypothetical protein
VPAVVAVVGGQDEGLVVELERARDGVVEDPTLTSTTQLIAHPHLRRADGRRDPVSLLP